MYPPNMRPTFINMSQENVDMRDSYLGEKRLWLGGQVGGGLPGKGRDPGTGRGAFVLRPGPLRLLHRAGPLERCAEPGPGRPPPPAHREGCHLYPGVRAMEAEG